MNTKQLIVAMEDYLSGKDIKRSGYGPQVDGDLDLVRRCFKVSQKCTTDVASLHELAERVTEEVLGQYPKSTRGRIATLIEREA